MKHRQSLICLLVCSLSCVTGNSMAAEPANTVSTEQIRQHLPGSWCLNKEVFMDEVSFSGEIWKFGSDNIYHITGMISDPYSIDGNKVKLDNMGTMEIQEISADHMVGKIYSTYHFARDACSAETREALRLTQLNNAIVLGNLDKAKQLVGAGVDVSKPDTRSMLESTPLMVAIKNNNEAAVDYILSLKPDLSVTDFMGRTALDHSKLKATSEAIRIKIKEAYER